MYVFIHVEHTAGCCLLAGVVLPLKYSESYGRCWSPQVVVKSFLTMGFGISDTLHLETDGLRCGNVSTLFMLGSNSCLQGGLACVQHCLNSALLYLKLVVLAHN